MARSCSPRTSRPPPRSSTRMRPSIARSRSRIRMRSRTGSATPARSSSGRGRRSPRATTRPARTTSSRPADWRARLIRLRSRPSAGSPRSSGSAAAASPRSARPSASRRGRGADGPPARDRGALRRRSGAPPVSPTPVTTGLPTQPPSYTWEATDEEVAARYGVPVGDILRFDLNTSPAPPELAARILAAGAFEAPLSEYPPTDYRRLIEAAASVYGVGRDALLVGAGADEILDITVKAFLPAGGRAVIPVLTYAMYRVLTEQRPAEALLVPRLGPDAGYALDLERTRSAGAEADLVWLCSPNNPTGLPEPDGAIEGLLAGLAADA